MNIQPQNFTQTINTNLQPQSLNNINGININTISLDFKNLSSDNSLKSKEAWKQINKDIQEFTNSEFSWSDNETTIFKEYISRCLEYKSNKKTSNKIPITVVIFHLITTCNIDNFITVISYIEDYVKKLDPKYSLYLMTSLFDMYDKLSNPRIKNTVNLNKIIKIFEFVYPKLCLFLVSSENQHISLSYEIFQLVQAILPYYSQNRDLFNIVVSRLFSTLTNNDLTLIVNDLQSDDRSYELLSFAISVQMMKFEIFESHLMRLSSYHSENSSYYRGHPEIYYNDVYDRVRLADLIRKNNCINFQEIKIGFAEKIYLYSNRIVEQIFITSTSITNLFIINLSENFENSADRIFLTKFKDRHGQFFVRIFYNIDGTYSTEPDGRGLKYAINESNVLCRTTNIDAFTLTALMKYYVLDSGTPEYPGYQGIKYHHEAVLHNFEKGFANNGNLIERTGFTADEIKKLLELHDIGKGIDHDDQHFFTKLVIKRNQQQLNLSAELARVITTIISYDPFGEYFTNKITLEQATLMLVNIYNKICKFRMIKKEQCFELILIFYICDMGSYPKLKSLHFEDQGMFVFKPHAQDIVDEIRQAFVHYNEIALTDTKVYDDPMLLIQNIDNYLGKNPNTILLINFTHIVEYSQVTNYLEELHIICVKHNIKIKITGDYNYDEIKNNLNDAGQIFLNSVNSNNLNLEEDQCQLTLLTSNAGLINNNLIKRTYIAFLPRNFNKSTREIKRLQQTNNKLEQIKLKQAQIQRNGAISYVNLEDYPDDDILKRFCNTGILGSVINDINFMERLQKTGYLALYGLGDNEKPWDYLSTSVFGQYAFEYPYGGDALLVIGVFNIDDSFNNEINFAFTKSPMHINFATSQLTKPVRNGDKVRIHTGHVKTDKFLPPEFVRDKSYDKNGFGRTIGETVTAIYSKKLSINSGKETDALLSKNTSELKISPKPNSINGIIINIPSRMMGSLWDNPNFSNDYIIQQLQENQLVRHKIQEIKNSSELNLPIYFYFRYTNNMDQAVEIFLKLPE